MSSPISLFPITYFTIVGAIYIYMYNIYIIHYIFIYYIYYICMAAMLSSRILHIFSQTHIQ